MNSERETRDVGASSAIHVHFIHTLTTETVAYKPSSVVCCCGESIMHIPLFNWHGPICYFQMKMIKLVDVFGYVITKGLGNAGRRDMQPASAIRKHILV